ncbi:MAG: hypothetical protein AABY85_10930 [Gemmatimonadota bacterium]|jgi:hypothetical protein
MPKKRTVRRRGICRIDQESTRTHGFFVRFGWYRRRDGAYVPRYRAFFGDVSHGGKRASLRAAEVWLAKTERAVKTVKTAKKRKTAKTEKTAKKVKTVKKVRKVRKGKKGKKGKKGRKRAGSAGRRRAA